MIRAKKIRLYPNQEQEQKMWQSVGTARFIYNWTLGKQQADYNLYYMPDNKVYTEYQF